MFLQSSLIEMSQLALESEFSQGSITVNGWSQVCFHFKIGKNSSRRLCYIAVCLLYSCSEMKSLLFGVLLWDTFPYVSLGGLNLTEKRVGWGPLLTVESTWQYQASGLNLKLLNSLSLYADIWKATVDINIQNKFDLLWAIWLLLVISYSLAIK